MRLDLFLKSARLVKRRTVAKEACDNGRIRVNGRVAKAGASLKVGDTITIDYGRRLLTVKVSEVPAGPVSKSAAASLYTVLSDEPAEGG